MKCRRQKASRGSPLRGPRQRPAHKSPATGKQPRPVAAAAAPMGKDGNTDLVLRIDDHRTGPIQHPGTVAIGPQGAVAGDIDATEIFVEGTVTGDLSAFKVIRVAASAKIVGDLCAPRIAVARGAELQGGITMRQHLAPPADLDDTAVDTLLSGGQSA